MTDLSRFIAIPQVLTKVSTTESSYLNSKKIFAFTEYKSQEENKIFHNKIAVSIKRPDKYQGMIYSHNAVFSQHI